MKDATQQKFSILSASIAAVLAFLLTNINAAYAVAASTSEASNANNSSNPIVFVLEIDGPIGPATSDYFKRNLELAQQQRAQLVVLQMNTPGGLDSSMRVIIRAILASPIPVAGFVGPQGARAASAGTYILYACHIAAMAPATNLGAATPVQIGGIGMPEPGVSEKDKEKTKDTKSAMEKKTINDATAYIRSLAELRGRNAEWAEEAVRSAKSLSSKAALENDVIDLVATNIADLLQKIDGRELQIQEKAITLNTKSAVIEYREPDWRNRFLSVITDPNIAYILMLIGVYGLILEFYNPGGIIPGVVGAICLLVALYAFQVLPVSYAGLGLIGLGIMLMVMEAFVPSTGVLGIGGVIAFIVGSVILMDTESEAFRIALPLIVAVAVFSALVLAFLIGLVLRARRSAVVSGEAAMIGESAEALEDFAHEGQVRVHGEIWHAVTEQPLHKGDTLPVKAVHGLQVTLGKPQQSGEKS